MTTEDLKTPADLSRLNENIAKIEELSARLVAALAQKKPIRPSLQGPGAELYMKAASAMMAQLLTDPGKMMEHQLNYWAKTLKHAAEAQAAVLADPENPVPEQGRAERPAVCQPGLGLQPLVQLHQAAIPAVVRSGRGHLGRPRRPVRT